MANPSPKVTLTTEEAASLRRGFKYCPRCRTELVDREVYGRVRRFCPNCRFVQFIDPKVGAAVLALTGDNRVLLVKRAVDPARGDWCLPGGFMEIGETPQQAAARECLEETGFSVDPETMKLVDVFYYEDYRGSGVLIMYQGQITGGTAAPGDDVSEVRFFGPDSLPENIAFASNIEALRRWQTETG
ncbi:MAG: NUDIX domain-containing protein [Chloroflexi bacterium]|nr:MAG: NUDIX domain-containing protein [Chloroflexota bacterium]